MRRFFLSAAIIIGITIFFPACSQREPGITSGKDKDLDSGKYNQLSGGNNIRNYLIKVSAEITDNFSSGIHSLNDWEKIRPQRYQEFIETMGIGHLPLNGKKTDLNVKITGTIQKDGYRIEKLYFESLPGLFVRANLYIPDN